MVARGMVWDNSAQPARWRLNWATASGAGAGAGAELTSLQSWFELIMAGEGKLTFSQVDTFTKAVNLTLAFPRVRAFEVRRSLK